MRRGDDTEVGRILRMGDLRRMEGPARQWEEDAVENDMRVMGFEKGMAPCFLLAFWWEEIFKTFQDMKITEL